MHGGRRARHEHCCVFLCALPACSPSLPTRNSQWSPRLMKLQRSATKLKALPTYAAATPLHTHPESWCLITPQTAADKEIRLRWRARKREKEKNWRRKKTAGTWINQRGWRKSDGNVGWEGEGDKRESSHLHAERGCKHKLWSGTESADDIRKRENHTPELLLTCTATHVDRRCNPSPLTYRCVPSCVTDGRRLGGGNGYQKLCVT